MLTAIMKKFYTYTGFLDMRNLINKYVEIKGLFYSYTACSIELKNLFRETQNKQQLQKLKQINIILIHN